MLSLPPTLLAAQRSVASGAGQRVVLELRVGDMASSTVDAVRRGSSGALRLRDVLTLVGSPRRAGDDAFVAVDSIALIIHTPLVIDWEDLTADISPSFGLPIVAAGARAHAREALRRRQNADMSAKMLTSVDRTPAPSIDYAVSSATGLRRDRCAVRPRASRDRRRDHVQRCPLCYCARGVACPRFRSRMPRCCEFSQHSVRAIAGWLPVSASVMTFCRA